MIAYLNGTIKDVFENKALIDVNGVGYDVYCNDRLCGSLSRKKGEAVEIYTHHYLRENAAELYGFSSIEEKSMFEILIGISGVGPKGALNILNAASLDVLQRAIAEGDASVLTRVSGIGNKIAQKIIVELKDKFGKEWAGLGGDIRGDSDVIEALESLGYSKGQAQAILKDIPKSATNTEDKVKEALKLLSK